MKKIIATLTALATLATASPIQSSAYCGELYAGDADHDGYITAATDSNFQYDIDVCYWEYVE